jgi:hypothetical protein
MWKEILSQKYLELNIFYITNLADVAIFHEALGSMELVHKWGNKSSAANK